MGRIVLFVALSLGLAAQAEAGPFGLFGRNSGCSSGSCSSGSSYSSVARVANAGACTSGLCAAPVSNDPGFVQVAPTQHENQLTADSNHGLSWDVAPERTVAVSREVKTNSLVSAYYSDVMIGKKRSGTTVRPSQVIARR